MPRAYVIPFVCLICLACRDDSVQPIGVLQYKIAFTYSDSIGVALAAVNRDGTDFTTVHRLPGSSFFLRWAPNGSKIAFDVYNARLGVVGADGTHFTLFAGTALNAVYGPWYSWFQDSERLAFSSNDTIYSLNINTGVQEAIGLGATPVVSPSGDRIAYVRNSTLFIMNPDGTAATNLADSVWGGLAWSPSGDRIGFVSEGGSLSTVTRAGGGILKLTPSGAAIPRILSWSPDANRIAFEWVYGIQIAKSDGSGTRTLAVNATSPSWCPDGTVIIYKASSPALVMVRPDGTDSTSVVPLKPEFSVVTWSPAPLP